MEWRGDIPEGFDVVVTHVEHWQNHLRSKKFIDNLLPVLEAESFDLVFGFNRMPGLDLYYAADPCYVERFDGFGQFIMRMTGRYRYYSFCEKAVFGAQAKTVALLLSKNQKYSFKNFYKTPNKRLRLMPPGIDKSRMRPDNADQIRADFRAKLGLNDQDKVALMIGTAFKTKGLDRAIKALSMLPDKLRHHTFLYVVGEGQYKPFERMAKKLGVSEHLRFFFGQDDVLSFLLSADCLLQPSYSETTGMAILEAIISGLPVLATHVCGYAFHVQRADAGRVSHSPFSITEFASLFEEVLTSPKRQRWMANGVAYAKREDLYSMPESVVEIIEELGSRKNH
jgi:UDP-glucose:(heptosyl)LPS alpha-1,3-glucosyltransferase